MVLIRSPHPDLNYPTNLTTWQWAFESEEYSPLHNPKGQRLGGYVNALTRERLDYAQVKEKSTNLSTALIRKYGLQPEETVSLFSTNTIWYPVAMWAVVRAGGRVNGASPAYTTDEMAYALKTAKSKLLITLPASLDVAVAAAEKAGLSKDRVLLLEGNVEGFSSIQQLMEFGKTYSPADPWRIPQGKTNREVCGYLNFSSGTTGLPKAVMLSHMNLIAQCMQLKQLQQYTPPYRILAVMPLFHITGLVRFCHYPIFMDGEGIMLPSFTMESMLKSIVDFEIEELILVPPILIRLIHDPIVTKYLPDLRRIVKRWSSGSAPISGEITQLLQKRFPDSGFRQGYGATESTACISCHPASHFDYKYATSGGMLCANTVAKVLDITTGKELGIGETGEILAKGPQIAMGYLGNEASTRETFDQDGFLHTGDVGHFTEEGLVYIEDRIKEMVKVKGLQVPPAELEDLLLGHDDVEDCAVLGIPDEYSGEKPKAFVVLQKRVEPSVEEGKKLLSYVKKNKVRYKWLTEVQFVESVPKSATGKLLRRVLKEQERKGGMSGLRVREEERARL